jgi:hypothetical protein
MEGVHIRDFTRIVVAAAESFAFSRSVRLWIGAERAGNGAAKEDDSTFVKNSLVVFSSGSEVSIYRVFYASHPRVGKF